MADFATSREWSYCSTSVPPGSFPNNTMDSVFRFVYDADWLSDATTPAWAKTSNPDEFPAITQTALMAISPECPTWRYNPGVRSGTLRGSVRTIWEADARYCADSAQFSVAYGKNGEYVGHSFSVTFAGDHMEYTPVEIPFNLDTNDDELVFAACAFGFILAEEAFVRFEDDLEIDLDCSPGCAECTGLGLSFPSPCSECEFLRAGSFCVPECPEKTFQTGASCIQCLTGCKNCSAESLNLAGACYECDREYYDDNGYLPGGVCAPDVTPPTVHVTGEEADGMLDIVCTFSEDVSGFTLLSIDSSLSTCGEPLSIVNFGVHSPRDYTFSVAGMDASCVVSILMVSVGTHTPRDVAGHALDMPDPVEFPWTVDAPTTTTTEVTTTSTTTTMTTAATAGTAGTTAGTTETVGNASTMTGTTTATSGTTSGTVNQQGAVIDNTEDGDGSSNVAVFAGVGGAIACICCVIVVAAVVVATRPKNYNDNDDDLEGATVKMTRTTTLTAHVQDLLTADTTEIIGRGGYGTVYKCMLDGTWVALKQLNDKRGKEEFHREATILSLFQTEQHPNIVEMKFFVEKPELVLAMALAERGSLNKCFKEGVVLSEADKLKIATGVSSGLAYIHEDHHVAWLDVKARNVLIAANFTPMISDFGIAVRVDQGVSAEAHVCALTPQYAPPERVRGEAQYGGDLYKVDVFGFGRLMWAIWSETEPFEGVPGEEVMALASSVYTMPALDARFEYCNLMELCCTEKPRDRPTMSSVCSTLSQLQVLDGATVIMGRSMSRMGDSASSNDGLLNSYPSGLLSGNAVSSLNSQS